MKNKGITLIALIITIVILLILAGLSISALTGSGLFAKAQDATRLSEIEEIEEVARLSYMERQLDEITGGENATMAGVISDLKEKGYKIKQITGGANTITGISLREEKVTVERKTEKTITYTLIYSEETTVRYFVEVQGKDYEILFNNGDITVNTEETNVGEISKEPEVTVTSSDSSIIEANKTEDGKIKLTAKDKIGDVTITIKEINSNVTKTVTATTRISATSLRISQTEATIKVGGTLNLTETVEPSNTTDEIIWSSSSDVATVTQDGLVTGVKGGTATITVTCGSLSKTCTVTIELFTGIDKSETDPEGALPKGDIEIIEDDATKGIVIKDQNEREWVWIQVPKTIFTTADALGEDRTEEELNAAIKADLIKYAGVYRNSPRNNSTDEWADHWYSGCGIADSGTYTTYYNKMLNSVYTNGGFWIQRYEDGTVNIRCGDAQIKASGYIPDTTKTSSLLFGIQWDLVCRYLDGNDGLTTEMINSDSSSWGRYNSTAQAKLDRNKKMNIYDFAGNLWEWTLEKSCNKSGLCSARGGSFGSVSGSKHPASYRTTFSTNSSNGGYSFRATFY